MIRYLVLVLVFMTAAAPGSAQDSYALSSRIEAQVIQSALGELRKRAAGVPTQLVPLRVALSESDKPEADGPPARIALVTVIDYASAAGWTVAVAPDSMKVLDATRLSGRPQSSAAERSRAEEIARRDSDVSRLLAAKAYLVGGFVVDPPGGEARIGRFLEFHVGSPDRRSILLELTIDVASEKIVGKRDIAALTAK